MKNLQIVEYHFGQKANIYSIQFDQNEKNEADFFFDKFQTEFPKEVNFIIDRLELFAEERGLEERYFRFEGSKLDALVALPEKRGNRKLRLFCLRLSNVVLIIGGGNIKDKATYQEVPELNELADFLQNLGKEIDERIRNKEIWYNEWDELKGDLNFEI